MRLVCIRHGQTDWNRLGKIQGVTDTPLNKNGIKAARDFVKRLKYTDYQFRKVYTSPLKRAYETGEVVAKAYKIPIFTKEGLTELSFGKFEGLTWDEVNKRFGKEYEYWDSHRKDAFPPEGESYYHKSGDIIRAMQEIVRETADSEDVLIVSHSASLKALLCPIRHVDYNDMLKYFPLGNLQEVVLSDRDIEEIMAYEG